MEKLPDSVDVVILGTGMTESLIAAAFSRIGHTVLHLDSNNYYGGDWASFNLETINGWASDKMNTTSQNVRDDNLIKDGEQLVHMRPTMNTINKVKLQIHASTFANENVQNITNIIEQVETENEEKQADNGGEKEQKKELENLENELPQSVNGNSKLEQNDAPTSDEHQKLTATSLSASSTWQNVYREWRKFGIDLIPKILFCRGSLVELLISSDVSKYCEFRCVSRILTLRDGRLEKVPCSRTDVFSSGNVSLIEKRILMKFMEFCLDYENHRAEYADFQQRPFKDFLNSKRLPPNIQHYVQNSIAMLPDSALTEQGLGAVKKFLLSLGRYGNTAFLWPLYGSGELSQAFCRMCAVFGGIYCLQCKVEAMITDVNSQRCSAVTVSTGQRIDCKWFISNVAYFPLPQCSVDDCTMRHIHRCVLITDRSILPEQQEQITLLSIPRFGGLEPITVLELSSISFVCPPNLYLVHLTTGSQSNDTEEELMPYVKQLFTLSPEHNEDANNSESMQGKSVQKPNVLWSLFFSIKSPAIEKSQLPNNVIVVSGPDSALDFDASVEEARAVFTQLCPESEFIPKAPNPEDIIWDDGVSQEKCPDAQNVDSLNEDSEISRLEDTEALSNASNILSSSDETLVDVEKQINS